MCGPWPLVEKLARPLFSAAAAKPAARRGSRAGPEPARGRPAASTAAFCAAPKPPPAVSSLRRNNCREGKKRSVFGNSEQATWTSLPHIVPEPATQERPSLLRLERIHHHERALTEPSHRDPAGFLPPQSAPRRAGRSGRDGRCAGLPPAARSRNLRQPGIVPRLWSFRWLRLAPGSFRQASLGAGNSS